MHGQLAPLNAAAWAIAVKETAAKTEVVYLSSREMKQITGQAMAAAVGINKEMRAYYESQMNVHFPAAPGKNILGLRVGMGDDGKAVLRTGTFDTTGTKSFEVRYLGDDFVAAGTTTTSVDVAKGKPKA